MNEQIPSSSNPEAEKIAQRLSQVAEQTHVNAQFAAELEDKLRKTRQPRSGWFAAMFKPLPPVLGWVTLMILLAVALSWSIKTLIPSPQLGGAITPDGFVCPVTQPNGSLPPGTQSSETAGVSDPNLFGNGELWTVLWPNGKVYMRSSNQRTDGSFETNWPWYRGVEGQLTIEGRRLDTQAGPLLYELPEGFNNFQGSTLVFPTVGCWQITGRVGDASLTFVTEVLFDATAATPTMITTPDIVAQGTRTPDVESGGYDWRGTKLYLATSLPESPAEANVFVVQPEQPATIESVRALADQFGMHGEIFEAELEPNAPSAFSVVDGNQSLNVRSDRYFEYIPDHTLINSERRFSIYNPNAEAIIDEFMKSHSFDFLYRVEPSELYQGFYVQALTPDGFPLHHEFFGQNGLLFRLSDTQIVSVSGSLLKYDRVGTYGIKSVEEAFQQVIESANFNGMIEGIHSSGSPPQIWTREYPPNETVTLYGWLHSNKPVTGQEMLVYLDGFPAVGNLAGAENLNKMTLVKATGQFTLENEGKVFHVESWEVYQKDDHGFSGKDAFIGRLQQQGEEVVLVSDAGTFIMPDVPADIPLPLENANVYGMALGDVFEWELIELVEAGNRGGGGSNGNGFYKLNLNGPAVPLPTPTAQSEINPGLGNYIVKDGDTCGVIAAQFGVSIQSIIDQNQLSAECVISVGQSLIIPGQQTDNPYVGRHFEKQRGILVITIYKRPDGSSREEFVFIMKNEDGSVFHTLLESPLENVSLEALRAYHNLPLDIWGTVKHVDQNGTPIMRVERYEVPFPDLQIQLLQGTQRLTEVEGQQVILFTTTNGTTYAQMLMYGMPDAMTILGNEGDEVILQVLAIPGETFGGYPTLYVFSAAMATNSKNNQPMEVEITADEPYVVDEIDSPETFVGPVATIETVELVYYIPDSRYTTFGEGSSTEYVQPAWRFYGHYDDGNEFEILIQALKQEYLLPELAPFTRPG